MIEDTSETFKPTSIMYGKVISANPLKINVEQRMVLDRKFLVLTDHLTKKTSEVSYRDYYRNSANEMTYTTRTAQVTFDNSLKVNDKVVLLREEGGQKFLVIDKVVSS